MSNTNYTPDEILQILNDFYNCQAVFDPEVDLGEELTFETTIGDWRTICDLIEPKKLANGYYDFFDLATSRIDLENIVSNQQNTLGIFCTYISKHAPKQIIAPVEILGQSCMTASIYKTLIRNLNKRGVKIQNIRPSSKFIPLFDRHKSIFLEEVNKLAPGSLTKFEYRDNWMVRTSWNIIGIFILSIIIVPITWHFNWMLMSILALGLAILILGKQFKPEKISIGGYDTVRDLILGMKAQMGKSS